MTEADLDASADVLPSIVEVLPSIVEKPNRLRRVLPTRTIRLPAIKPRQERSVPAVVQPVVAPPAPAEPRNPNLVDETVWRVQAFGVGTGGEFAYEPRQMQGEWRARKAAKELLESFPRGTARVECELWNEMTAMTGAAARFGIH
jgi:hypothetical protein